MIFLCLALGVSGQSDFLLRTRRYDKRDAVANLDFFRHISEFITLAFINATAMNQQHRGVAMGEAEDGLPEPLSKFARVTGIAETFDFYAYGIAFR